MNQVVARAPGKVNLALHVGAPGDDGYHPLVTVFQAVNLWEQVTATLLPPGSGIVVTASGVGAQNVPLDHTNLAYRAAEALAAHCGIIADVALHIEKGVPVAGGMAGGSADAAATLVACNELWQTYLPQTELLELAGELGSDVPFCLIGGTAIGRGRGHLLTPINKPKIPLQHWAFAIQTKGLSTPAVFNEFDQLGSFSDLTAPTLTDFENDLQRAALALRPELAEVIFVAKNTGASRTMVSGSGPTVAALAPSAAQAKQIASAWLNHHVADAVATATSTNKGAHII